MHHLLEMLLDLPLLHDDAAKQLCALTIKNTVVSLGDINAGTGVFPAVIVDKRYGKSARRGALSAAPCRALHQLAHVVGGLAFCDEECNLAHCLTSRELQHLSGINQIRVFELILVQGIDFFVPASVAEGRFRDVVEAVSGLDRVGFRLHSVVCPGGAARDGRSSGRADFDLPDSDLSVLLELDFVVDAPGVAAFSVRLQALDSRVEVYARSGQDEVHRLRADFPLEKPLHHRIR